MSQPQVLAILELRLQKLTALGINEIEVENKKMGTLFKVIFGYNYKNNDFYGFE